MHILLILLPGVLLWSCGGRGYDPRLLHAGRLVDSLPDSAVSLLASVDVGRLSTRNRALHSVLLARACDKSFVDLQSDSVIAPALEYFDRHESAPYTMWAWYYAARASQNASDHGMAIFRFLQAEDYAQAAGDHLTLGLIYRNIADIYTDNYHAPKALEYRRKSLEEFRMSGQSGHALWAKVYLMVAYSNAAELDSATSLGSMLLSDTLIAADNYLHNLCLTTMGRVYYQREDFGRAIDFFAETDEVKMRRRDSDEWILMMTAFKHLNLGDSVAKYALEAPLDSLSYLELYSLGEYQRAFNKYKLEIDKSDSIITRFNQPDVSRAVSQFMDLQSEIKEQRHYNMLLTVVSVAVIIVIIMSAIVWQIHLQRKKNRYKYEVAMESLKTLTMQFSEVDKQLSQARDQLLNIMPTSTGTLKGLINILDLYPESVSSKVSRKKDYLLKGVNDVISRFMPGGEAMSNLEQCADAYCSGVVSKYKELCRQTKTKSIREAELAFVVYLALDLDSTVISHLLGISSDAVYNRKSRLKAKLANISTALSLEIRTLLKL